MKLESYTRPWSFRDAVLDWHFWRDVAAMTLVWLMLGAFVWCALHIPQ